jgi:hypothetical protein
MRIAVVCLFTMLATITGSLNAEVTINDRTDVDFTVYIPCAAGGLGEVVALAGPLHTMLSYTINSNNVGGLFHFQPQGISGLGESSGNTYQAMGVTKESFKVSLQNEQAAVTFVNNFRLVGQGTGNSFLVHESLHFTFNANGSVTVIHDNFMVECR